jgi:hypothetical protein
VKEAQQREEREARERASAGEEELLEKRWKTDETNES